MYDFPYFCPVSVVSLFQLKVADSVIGNESDRDFDFELLFVGCSLGFPGILIA